MSYCPVRRPLKKAAPARMARGEKIPLNRKFGLSKTAASPEVQACHSLEDPMNAQFVQ
jgi:hypothetical protein